MADTPTPPAPPRRKAATGPRKTSRTTPPKAKAPAGGSSASPAVKAPAKRTGAGKTPREPASIADRAKTTTKSASAKVGRAAGTATRKVADTASTARQSIAQSSPVQSVSETRERMGDRNFLAALIGGIAAIGAAAGGIFYALRDGHGDRPDKPPKA